ncbi:MAG: ABC transporter permease [Bifidobacteriaceae bacterium]|jgi:ABC-2 type transport system permease protein|nr:ABC transporter permease [Bifidobacteriaceae bacterium]
MTAAAMPATVRRYQTARGRGLTFAGLVKSEWVKLRSLRSTWWCAILLIVFSVGFGVPIAGAMMDRREGVAGPQGADDFTVLLANNGLTILGQIVAVVLGALIVTTEYGSGSIRSTLVAAPRRTWVFAAKVIIAAVFAGVVAAVALGATVGGIVALLQGAGQDNGLGAHASALAGGGIYYLVVTALIGVGLGFVLRSSAGAIAAGIALMFVAPMILALGAGNEVVRFILEITPMQAGALMTTSVPSQHGAGLALGGYWGGAACLAAWAVVALVPAYIAFKRRDA